METALDAKADKTAMETALEAKADKTAMETALDAKADKTDLVPINTALNSKAKKNFKLKIFLQIFEKCKGRIINFYNF
jgi:hypothetical protein